MVILQIRRTRNNILLSTIWSHLESSAIRQPCDELLALITPANCADTRFQHLAIGTREQVSGFQIGYEEIAPGCDKRNKG